MKALGTIIALALSNSVIAQNISTSYDANTIPVVGIRNCAVGTGVLSSSTTGSNENVGIGIFALLNNTSGYFNTASGYKALYANTTGNNNTASGHTALALNTTGYYNVAVGVGALSLLTLPVMITLRQVLRQSAPRFRVQRM